MKLTHLSLYMQCRHVLTRSRGVLQRSRSCPITCVHSVLRLLPRLRRRSTTACVPRKKETRTDGRKEVNGFWGGLRGSHERLRSSGMPRLIGRSSTTATSSWCSAPRCLRLHHLTPNLALSLSLRAGATESLAPWCVGDGGLRVGEVWRCRVKLLAYPGVMMRP